MDPERLADAERAFQDARAAVDAGDIEGGIVALERLLLLRPGLGNIQFELGLLYARVGANDRARFYLDESLKDESMPPEVRRRAEAEIARMDESVSPHDFSGLVALRVQSDTNPGADSARKQFVDLIAGPVEGDSDEPAEQDTSLHATLDTGYRYRIDDRSGLSIGGGLSTSTYAEQDDLDEQRLLLRAGYDYRLRGDAERTDYFPQLLYSTTRRDGDRYGDTVGIALGARASTRRSSRGVALRVSTVRFEESSNAGREGTRLSVDGYFGIALGPVTSARFGYDIGRSDLESDAESHRRVGANASLSRRFAFGEGRAATLTGQATLAARFYDEPDPFINPDRTRSDTVPGVSLSLAVPLANGIALRARAGYVDNRSTLPNFDYDNTQVSLGIDWAF